MKILFGLVSLVLATSMLAESLWIPYIGHSRITAEDQLIKAEYDSFDYGVKSLSFYDEGLFFGIDLDLSRGQVKGGGLSIDMDITTLGVDLGYEWSGVVPFVGIYRQEVAASFFGHQIADEDEWSLKSGAWFSFDSGRVMGAVTNLRDTDGLGGTIAAYRSISHRWSAFGQLAFPLTDDTDGFRISIGLGRTF